MYTMLYQVKDEDGLRAAIEAYQKEHYEQFGELPSDVVYNAARELLYKSWLHADEGSNGNETMQQLLASQFGQYIYGDP